VDDGSARLVALSRPHHYVLFGLFLVALFAGTFRVTQAMVPAPAPEEVASLPLLVETELPEPLPAAEPEPRPDLVVASLSARECFSSSPQRPGGLLTITVRNAGEGPVRGSKLFAGLEVRNVDAGGSLAVERGVWIERLGAGEEVRFQIPYGFPVREAPVLGTVSASQPVPGSYRLSVILDHPSTLPVLGDVGVVEETDEQNNRAEARTTGIADGLC
jgi:hypothetical protein